MGMGNDWSKSRVDCDIEGFECGTRGISNWFFAFGAKGTGSSGSGVCGDAELDEDDSELEGDRGGNGMWCVLWWRWECECAARWEWELRVTAESPSWWLKMSSSTTPSSKSSTSRSSRSMRPTSRFPKTPVQSAQWTFLSVESLRYYRGGRVVSITYCKIKGKRD